MWSFRKAGVVCSLLIGLAAACAAPPPAADCEHLVSRTESTRWSPADLRTICSLWLEQLPPPPADPSNAYADDPAAAALGETLFFDTGLSANNDVSCATCHQPERAFTDGLPVAEGTTLGTRNTMTIVGTAYSPWFFWDGHADSQWSQALEPLESPHEHALTRQQVVDHITIHYATDYERVFGPLAQQSPDETFVNVGKAIAAYERTVMFAPSRFDRYVAALMKGDERQASGHLTADEVAGLDVFIGQGQCIQCHNGPLFTNFEFHNTAVSQVPVDGRFSGAEVVLADEFNCLGPYSDAEAAHCAELRFIKSDGTLLGAFKTPTLRDVALTSPYMHAGQFATLEEVIAHYNQAPERVRSPAYGHNELTAIALTSQQQAQLVAFLMTLTGEDDADR